MKGWKSTTLAAVMMLLGACSGQSARHEGAASAAPAASASASSAAPIPEASPLSKVKPGMNFKAVRGLLGPPADENTYPTGKAFTPFYYGNDARRTAWYYKNMGRVTFAAGNVYGGASEGEVISVEYDPSETGVSR